MVAGMILELKTVLGLLARRLKRERSSKPKEKGDTNRTFDPVSRRALASKE